MRKIEVPYRKRVAGLLMLLLLFISGCVKNDLPYPYIRLYITDFKVEGQSGSSYIDNENRIVNVTLRDTTHIGRVKVNTLSHTDEAKVTLQEGDIIDLSKDYKVTLSLYQDYEWTIKTTQPFDYKFTVDGQVGEAEFDESKKQAFVYVAPKTDLRYIMVRELQLGPSDATLTLDPAEGLYYNFTESRTVIAMYHDKKVAWDLYVTPLEVTVLTGTPDVWVKVAWLKGEGMGDDSYGFEYRKAVDEEWITVDPDIVTGNGTAFSARLTGLEELTTYVYRAVSGGEYATEVSFTTGEALPLPGGSFDYWHQSGKVWNPWAEDGERFWDTGNKGAVIASSSNTYPTSEIWSGKTTGQAAKMESKYILGKLAAGNIYVGEYIRTDGTNGVLDFGRPFDSYPTRLKGYFKYTSVPISHTTSNVIPLDYMKGRPDTCRIYIALGDWNSPVEVKTKPSEFKVLDINDPNIIAYAEYNQGFSNSTYQELDLELEYRYTNRKPKYLLIVCSASKYGDYFTGGDGSVLWLDEFTLEYDY